MSLRQKVIEALREMSREDFVPLQADIGICWHAEKIVIGSIRTGEDLAKSDQMYLILRACFIGLGKDRIMLLGNWFAYKNLNLWAGEEGEKRRKFAGECADWLEQNP